MHQTSRKVGASNKLVFWESMNRFETISRLFQIGGDMELRDCKFYYGGQEMNFAVFSDDPCRATYLESIPLPIAQTRVDVYGIEPGAKTQWILVKQKDGDRDNVKLFIRKGEKFLENETQSVPKELKKQILQRFPKLTTEFSSLLAA
jgi:hypothetical protein